MYKMTLAKALKEVERRMLEVGKVRDKLDDTIAEIRELREDAQEAFDSLDDARDALSRLV